MTVCMCVFVCVCVAALVLVASAVSVTISIKKFGVMTCNLLLTYEEKNIFYIVEKIFQISSKKLIFKTFVVKIFSRIFHPQPQPSAWYQLYKSERNSYLPYIVINTACYWPLFQYIWTSITSLHYIDHAYRSIDIICLISVYIVHHHLLIHVLCLN